MPLFSIRSFRLLAALSSALGTATMASAQTTTPTPVPTIPNSTFVPASGFFDFVADNARGMLYLSRGTQVLRYRRSDQTWLAPVEVGGDLRALDISPDGNTLAVADSRNFSSATPGTVPSARIALVNLNTFAVTNILFPLRSGEAGTYSLAYAANGNLFIAPAISPTTGQAGAFRVWDANTNQTAVIYARTASGGINDSGVATNTAIVADTTRNCLSFVEMGSQTGRWGFYSPSGTSPTGTVGTLTRFMDGMGINGGNYPNDVPYGIAPDNGSRLFIPTGSSLQVRSSVGYFISRYGSSSAPYNSATFDSSRSLLYLTPSTSAKIEIRDPSLNTLGFLNAGMAWAGSPSVTSAGIPLPYAISRMRAASDGTLLGVRVTDGVRLYDLQDGLPASTATPLVTDSFTTPEDKTYSFALDSPARNASGTTYDITFRPPHGTLTGNGVQSSLNFTYTPAPNYNGGDYFTVRVYTPGAEPITYNVVITVTPVNDAPVAIDGAIFNHTNESRFLPLRATDVDRSLPFQTDPNSSFDIVTKPAHGIVFRASGPSLAYYYAPEPNYAGDDSFTFRAFDGQAYSNNVATFTIKNVGPIPVARDDSFSAPYAPSVTIPAPGLLANDIQSNTSYIALTLSASSGKVLLNPDGSFTWTAGEAGLPESGLVTFEYVLTDAYYQGAPRQATVTLNLAPLVAQSQSLTTGEDIPLPVHLNVLGAPAPTYSITKVPAHGTLSGTAPDLTYTPDVDTNGADSFEFSITDGGRTATGTVSITVNPINDAPGAPDSTLATDEDTPLAITLPAADVEADTLSYEIVQAPPLGTLVAGATPGTYTYTPPANFNGPIFFAWRANDGSLNSRVAEFKITVTPINDAPVASALSATTDEDTAVSVLLKASDVDNSPASLTFKVTKAPAHGKLVGNSPNLSYQPDANWNGADSFEFVANDGALDSAPATGTVTVASLNDAPTSQSQTVTGNEDTNIDVTLGGSDIEGDALTFEITRPPSHGTLKQTGSAIVYRAFDDWNGTDSFGFVAKDATLSSSEATVTVFVAPVSDTPVAHADAYSTDEDTALSISAPGALTNDVDVDGQTLRAVLKSQPANGSVALNANGAFTYTPDHDWSGTDSFTYAATDGTLESAAVKITITVAPINDAPVARPDVVAGTEDTPLTIQSSALLANDFDVEGDTLSITALTHPVHGTLVAQDGSYLYTPAADFNGDDTFGYTLNDGTASATGSVTIHIKAVNDAPRAEAQTVSFDEDNAKSIILSGTDVDGDVLTFAITTQPTNGVLSGMVPDLTYTPKANFNGTDSFTFSASDSFGLRSTATVSLVVRSVNDAPTATPLSLTTSTLAAKSFSVLTNASDVDGDALTFALKAAPANGTVTSQGGANFTYTPRLAFVGTDSFAIAATDLSGASATVQVSVSVTALPTQPNRAPSSQGSNFVILEDGTLTFNLVATDQDGDALIYIITQNPQSGMLRPNGGASFTFTPPANYFGTQTFNFQVRDARGATSNTSTVELRTVAVNDVPSYDLSSTALTVAKNSNVFQQSAFARNLNVGGLPYEQGQNITFSLQASDTSLFDQQPGISSTGILTFRPRNGKTGTATVTINARDNGGTSDGGKDTAPTKTFTIIIR